MENLRIAVIGNIGVGKSTLINAIQSQEIRDIMLKHLPNFKQADCLHTFAEEFDPDVLDAFYKDPIRNAFMAQIEFFNGRLERQAKIEQARGIVLEDRTIFEDYHIFGKAQKIMGHLTDAEYIAYQRNYQLMMEKIDEPDLIVYLKADVPTLKKRIARRGRDSEKSIPTEYLALLNNLYEEFVTQHVKCATLIIDARDATDLSQYLEETTRKVSNKLKEMDLRITTTGLKEWVALPETEAAIRAVEAERQLEDYLKDNHRLITVAGNVGMGKSTVTTLMHRSLRIKALYENPLKNPLLGKFLQDKKKYCCDLQRHFLKMRANQRREGKDGKSSYVKDRSLAEDILVFCRQFHEAGHLSSSELDLLTTEFHKTNRELPPSDLMIVLKGRPEIAWQRIQQRGREMEIKGGWTFPEIKSLNRYYRTYSKDVREFGYHDNPILEFNVNKIDFANRVHMGYLFESTYQALQQLD